MKAQTSYFHCGDQLKNTLSPEIGEVQSVVEAIAWAESFQYCENGSTYEHQAAYNFQYGLANGLLSLAVLIVPTTPAKFFPTRPQSVQNMAEYSLAYTCLSVLPINVPALLVGLLPENGCKR